MNSTTTPATFATEHVAELGGDIHRGPAAGIVKTTWTPEEGLLVYVGELEGMTPAEAAELAADLRDVLGRLAGLQ